MKISIKTVFLFSFILLEFLSVMAFANTPVIPGPLVVPDAVADKRIKVTVNLTIGRRRDCQGFGICEFSIDISTGKIYTCSGTLYLDEFNRNIMVLEVDKARLSGEVYNKYFSSGTFLMEDDSPLPADVLKALQLSGSKTLLSGRHKVIERNGLISVSIPVK